MSERERREKVSERRYIYRWIEIEGCDIEREGVGRGVGITYCGGGTNRRDEDMLG